MTLRALGLVVALPARWCGRSFLRRFNRYGRVSRFGTVEYSLRWAYGLAVVLGEPTVSEHDVARVNAILARVRGETHR